MARLIKFARFGGLSPVVQKGYTTNPDERGFHTPPARKGFYAFIWPYYEFFLLGGDFSKLGSKYNTAKFEYLKDRNGNKIKYDVDNTELKKHLTQGKYVSYKRSEAFSDISWKIWEHNGYAVVKKRPKIFTFTGELWHHFNNNSIKPSDTIDRIGDWIKTDYETFVKAFHKDKIIAMLDQRRIGYELEQINPKSPYNSISKDHLEVFIERIK